jgi:YesN/AraC family two-component response regulator
MKPRILFVDDEPLVVKGLEMLLSRQLDLWDMLFVQRGEEALQAFLRSPFDMVVSDVTMPGIDGIELVTRLKAKAPKTQCLFLTGYVDQVRVQELLADGTVRETLSKPCSKDDLLEAIDRCIT